MHEYAVTKSILEIALEEAKKSNALKINKITLVLGELSTFIDDSISLYFDIFSKNTIAEGAKLCFIRKDAEFLCIKCNKNFKKNSNYLCPDCNVGGIPTDIGKEFYIDNIDID